MRRRLVEVAAGCAGGMAVAGLGLAAWIRQMERRIERHATGPWDEAA